MPVQPPESPEPPERWSADRVLGHAPDTAVGQAARVVAGSGRWHETGHATEPPGLWGLVRGSGRTPYQVCVDLAEPAYRCTCPSRKIPCKHAVGLLLLWADGGVPTTDPPAWFTEWLAERDARRQRAATRAEGRTSRTAGPDDEPTATQVRRSARVDSGIDELERWLADQVRSGIAGAGRAGYRHWDAMAERLVDAQAPALASGVRRLAAYAGTPDRLLAELGLLRLAVTGWRRREQLPADLVENVRGRIGFPVSADDVLAGAAVRDEWTVIGIRDELDRRLSLRRAWLRGVGTGRDALVLSFAPPGVPLAGDLVLGTSIEADLCFYPGRGNLRALVRARHGDPRPATEPPGGTATVAEALRRYASSLADNPWQDRVPMLLTAVRLAPAGAGSAAGGRWHLLDRDDDALPLYPPAERPWRLLAAAGGEPATVAGEWSADGLRPLAMWIDGRLVVP